MFVSRLMPLLEAWLKLQRKEESSLIQNQEGELAWKEATHIVVWNLVEFTHIEKCCPPARATAFGYETWDTTF